MGWTSSNSIVSKQSIVQDVIDWGTRFSTLAHSVRGNHVWVLLQHNEGEKAGQVFIALYLLRKDDGYWSYKGLDDSCFPYYYDCPKSFIERTQASNRQLSQSTIDWHEAVFKYHKEQANQRKKMAELKAGMKVKFQDTIYELLSKYEGRKGWLVRCIQNNETYRMMAKQVKAATIIPA